MPSDHLFFLMLLTGGVFRLLKQSITQTELQEAHTYLKLFSAQAPVFYGKICICEEFVNSYTCTVVLWEILELPHYHTMFHAIHIINIISYSCVYLLNFQANSSRHSMYTSCCTLQRLLGTLVLYGLIHASPLRIITVIYEIYSMGPRMLMARFVFNSTRTCISNCVCLQIVVIKMMLHIIIIV